MGLRRFTLAVMHRQAGGTAKKLRGKLLRARPGATQEEEICKRDTETKGDLGDVLIGLETGHTKRRKNMCV